MNLPGSENAFGAMELLVFRVPPSDRPRFLSLDREGWTRSLSDHPGFSGKRVWTNSENESEIWMTIGWNDRTSWKSFPESKARDLDRAVKGLAALKEEIELQPAWVPVEGGWIRSGISDSVFFHDGTGALEVWMFQVPPDRQELFKDLVYRLWLQKIALQPGYQEKGIWFNPVREEEILVSIGWRNSDDWRRLPNSLFSGFHRHSAGMIEGRRYVELIPLADTVRPDQGSNSSSSF